MCSTQNSVASVVPNQELLLDVYGKRPLTLVKASGVHVWDDKGKQYIDLVQGVAVQPLGHNHPVVLKAIHDQVDSLIHVSNLYHTPAQHLLAAELFALGSFHKLFFCNSGTEANEAAIKFARKYWHHKGATDRIQIISFNQSFHGRTYGSLAATGQEKFQKGFGPMLSGFTALPLGDVSALQKAVSHKTAAMILEPILAEGGVMMPSKEFLAEIFALKEKFGFLMIADEVQTAFGRMGAFFGSSNWPGKADIITLAKPLGGGLPLGATLLNEAVASAIAAGDHGSTFGGNPVACAAGAAILSVMREPNFFEASTLRARVFRQKILAWVLAHPREFGPSLLGEGWLIGIPTTLDLTKFQACCRSHGLLVHRAGVSVMRFLPPLTLSEDVMDQVIDILEQSFKTYHQTGETV